ncbi:toxin HicA [Gordonia sp. DT219]|uniref:toxin HicA n=1 Tax=Gordonia sp. DT219 TaxID=3416658 RepID=UPI003CF53CEC
MGKLERTLATMRSSPSGVRYDDLMHVCRRYFGAPRQSGGSHAVFKMPWAGDPRVNIQKNKDGTAKAYQVRQVLAAVKWYEQDGHEDVS